MLDRKARGRGARVDPKLLINGCQVRIDGARTEYQALGSLGIAEPLSHQAQDLDLAFRQLIQPLLPLALCLESLALDQLSGVRDTQSLSFFIKLFKLLFS